MDLPRNLLPNLLWNLPRNLLTCSGTVCRTSSGSAAEPHPEPAPKLALSLLRSLCYGRRPLRFAVGEYCLDALGPVSMV